MANSFVRFTQTGSTTTYSLGFTYRSQADISVTLNGVATTAFSYNAAGTQIIFNTAPATGTAIQITRATSQDSKLVDYAEGSVLTEGDLDTDSAQGFFMGQEAIDKANDVIGVDATNFQWTAGNLRITNVADPTSAQDVATKNYLETVWLSTSDKTNLTTVAGINTEISNVAAKTTEITNVSTDIANVNTVATNIGSVNTVATDITKVIAVANDLAEAVSEIETVADDLNEATSEIDTVSNNIANVNIVGANDANVTKVAVIDANVTKVANIDANVTKVANIDANVTKVANIDANVTTVANNDTNVSKVAVIDANVTTVANNDGNVTIVATANTNVGLVGGAITNVNTVATNLTNVNAFSQTYLGAFGTAPTQTGTGAALADGMLYFDSASDILKVYAGGSGWQSAGSSVNGTANRYQFTLTSAGSILTGNDVNGNNLVYDANFIDVFLNGVKLRNGTDVTVTSGSSLVFANTLQIGDIVDAIAYGTFAVANLNASNITSGTLSTGRGGTGLSSLGTAGQALVVNPAGNALQYANASSAEVYGFNLSDTNSDGILDSLIVTTTNGGADNINSATYSAFDDVLYAATGFSWSLNASGHLIATV
tara:strand:- start:7001 stop:8806 length:1806 start_codon:yes stop_codon:yes gene_type:complete